MSIERALQARAGRVRNDVEAPSAHRTTPSASPRRFGITVWLTGLSGAGKSTIAQALASRLRQDHRNNVEVLDGDVVRENLSKGLGFSKEDRDTNIRRIGFVADLLTRHGVIVIVAAISPYREVRREVLGTIGCALEVYVRCPLDELVRRDVKGLYRRAMAGEVPQFTGISDPYEEPDHPDLILDTALDTVEDCVGRVVLALYQRELDEAACD